MKAILNLVVFELGFLLGVTSMCLFKVSKDSSSADTKQAENKAE